MVFLDTSFALNIDCSVIFFPRVLDFGASLRAFNLELNPFIVSLIKEI